MKVRNNTNRPLVYICSPYRPVLSDPILRANELVDDLKLARDACTLAVFRGYEPIAPHLYYPQFLNDENENERALGMELGMSAACVPLCVGYLVSICRLVCSLQKGNVMENLNIAQSTATIPAITNKTTLRDLLSILGLEQRQKNRERHLQRQNS